MRSTSSPVVIGQLLAGTLLLTLGLVNCSRGERVLGESLGEDSGIGNTFVEPPDAATLDASFELTSYCPSNKCPAGYTTCPSSRFPCDVNLQNDRDNCGACGVVCPASTERETFECVEGHCVMGCSTYPLTLDCDGVVDNGCETDPGSNDNCASCGDKCLDPAKPCLDPSLIGGAYTCGCDADHLYCEFAFPLFCIDPKTNDFNCGACDVRCDPAGDGGTPPPNTYYGCLEAHCNELKCKQDYANCDDDMSDGCETSLFDPNNCGVCGNVCPAGTACRADSGGRPMCACPPGQTYCTTGCNGDACVGECVDLASDRLNCGSCGFSCSNMFVTQTVAVCSFGTCSQRCSQGRADCNGNSADDCEVDINSDPRNCGGCGIACDAIAGQACVGGRCVVEPCDQDAGSGTAR
ncbi:MAG: hypothetical protein K0S65_3048 [Labilithrix sp.]|nr:hypothetical protein [Labilithrix sp.]